MSSGETEALLLPFGSYRTRAGTVCVDNATILAKSDMIAGYQ